MTTRNELNAVILAGGAARRMGGGDQCLKPLGGRVILDHVLERLAPQVGGAENVLLSMNGDPARFDAFGLATAVDAALDDAGGGFGPLSGVLAGLDWARDRGATHVVSVAADTPFFPSDLVERLTDAAEAAATPIALAATPDQTGRLRAHPTFGRWPVALADDLRAALHEEGLRKILDWTDRHGAALAAFDAEPLDPFFNVNTPDELAEAERLAT